MRLLGKLCFLLYMLNSATSLDPGPPLSKNDLQEENNEESPETIRASLEFAMTHERFDVENEKNIQTRKKRAISRSASELWPNKLVPYIIDENFNDTDRKIIAWSIKQLEDNSCVKWREKEADDKSWVIIEKTEEYKCEGSIGKALGAKHYLILGPPCVRKVVVLHEMMHILGFEHEHLRPDRDKYIKIDWTNIRLGDSPAYWRASWNDSSNLPSCSKEGQEQSTADFSNCVSSKTLEDYGLEYDFESIMHYGDKDFAVDRKKPTFVKRNTSDNTKIGGDKLSKLDKERLKKAYGCDSCGGHFISTSGGILYGSPSDAKSPCEYVIETTPNHGIEISISQMTGNCSTQYLEVRLGGYRFEPLFGKLCMDSENPTRIDANFVWIKWVRPDSSANVSSMAASWKSFGGGESCKHADDPGAMRWTGKSPEYQKTISGKICQKWSSQTPHKHRMEIIDGNDHNYCRNPDGEPGLWCYTTDTKTRWELCTQPPFCPGGELCKNADDPKAMRWTGKSPEYQKTISGKTCQKWSSQTPHKHHMGIIDGRDHNYCRNPDGEPGLWCYTTDIKTRWELCTQPPICLGNGLEPVGAEN